jgi:hypothetical protein
VTRYRHRERLSRYSSDRRTLSDLEPRAQ